MPSQEDLNEEEATAIGEEVAEVSDEDEHHARDANISMLYLHSYQPSSSSPRGSSLPLMYALDQ